MQSYNIKRKIIFALIFFAGVLFLPKASSAVCSWDQNTGTAASPYSGADIQDCINDAALKSGQVTIQIPDSSSVWSIGINVNMQSGWNNVSKLVIRGQNDCVLDQNGIPTACGTDITNFYLSYTGKEGKDFRLAHLKINGTSGVSINGDGKTWRIDHIFWDTVTGYTSNRIIWIGKSAATWLTEGVIDHNYFLNWAWGTIIHYQPNGGLDGSNYEWMADLGLGTSHAIYLENNKIYRNLPGYYITDNNGASRWVFRYNEVTNAYLGGHDFVNSDYNSRGARKIEVYNNTFFYPVDQCWVMYRAGANGVFFNNTINKTGTSCGNGVSLKMWRTDCTSATGKSYLATASTYPQACLSGTGCIDIDGKSNPAGYPCRDQVGVSGNDPQIGGGQPFLFWNNTYNGSPMTTVGADENYVVSGRDFCINAATMPSSCNGVITAYAPYTYPHPLRTGSVPSDTTPPAAPSGVIVN